MKKFITLLMALCLSLFCFAACATPDNGADGGFGDTSTQTPEDPQQPSSPTEPDLPTGPTEPESPDGDAPIEPADPEQPGGTPDDPVEPIEQAYTFTEDGTGILFGSYPQTRVTDEDTVAALNQTAGGTPAAEDRGQWQAYEYYIEGERSDFMWHIDLTYGEDVYRGVYFTQYRPYYTTIESSAEQSYQDENEYNADTVYWFRYEPVLWRILSRGEDRMLVMADIVLDSMEYYPFRDGQSSSANNYAESSLRAWLNGQFYSTAFSAEEQTNILLSTVDNSAPSTGFAGNEYAASETNDNVFALSYSEVTNADHGFTDDSSRVLSTSDYAKAQGLRQDGGSRWWLRSPNNTYDFYARYVDGYGFAEYNNYVYWTHIGVVPAINIRLFEEEEQENDILVAYFSRMGEGRYGDRFTHNFAVTLQEYLPKATLFDIVPTEPYPADFSATQERASREWAQNARPEISGEVENFDEYETVFIGYPIWNGHAPRIIYTFFDTYDLSGKNVYLFATASSSSMSGSVSELKETYPDVDILSYLRVTSSAVNTERGKAQIYDWLTSMSL